MNTEPTPAGTLLSPPPCSAFWTPVSQALPPECRCGVSYEVLITARSLNGKNTVVKIDKYDAHAGAWYDHDSETWGVLAWAPLIPYLPNTPAHPPQVG